MRCTRRCVISVVRRIDSGKGLLITEADFPLMNMRRECAPERVIQFRRN